MEGLDSQPSLLVRVSAFNCNLILNTRYAKGNTNLDQACFLHSVIDFQKFKPGQDHDPLKKRPAWGQSFLAFIQAKSPKKDQ